MKILNFGSCNVDYVYNLDHIVHRGETETAQGFSVFPGGKGLNQSIALARAGVKVYAAGCIGEDGGFLKDLLCEAGADTSFLMPVAGKNGHAVIQVSREGENSIFIYPGSNAAVTREQIDLVLSHFGAGDLLLLQNEISELAYLVDRAHARGMQILLNPSPCNQTVLALDLGQISYLILNEIEACAITGCEDPEQALGYFQRQYPYLKVMLTLGKNGCVYLENGKRYRHPIFCVEVVDTTAAGDTFTGYFAAGLYRGEPPETVLKVASCAAALSVSRAGAAPSIPTRGEVEQALERLEAAPAEEKAQQLLRAALQYMRADPIAANAQHFAAAQGYSPSYTNALLKQASGSCFGGLLRQVRVDLAAELLERTALSVGEIIHRVGYENESFFRSAFVERYGKTPLEYRKHAKGERT